MENYDAGFYPRSRRFRHTVALEIMHGGESKARLLRVIEGSSRGAGCLAFADLKDFYPCMVLVDNAKHAVVDEEGELVGVRIFDVDGKESQLTVQEASDFLVGVRIVNVEVLNAQLERKTI